MDRLTFVQHLILECIEKYVKEHDEAPTLRELCDLLSINTVSTVHKHLHNLKEKGYIDILPRIKRGIVLKNNNEKENI